VSITLPVTGVGNSAAPNQWSSAPNGVIQVIASANDSNFAEDTSNGGGTTTLNQGYELNDTPANFGNMVSLNIRLRYGWAAAFNNRTWASLNARIMSGATVLAAADSGGAFTEVAATITNTTPVTSSVVSFAYIDTTADKVAWDAAVLEMQIVSVRSGGGSSIARRVYAGEATGIYALAGNNLTEVRTDSIGLGDESNENLVKPATVPDAVTNLAGVAGNSQVTLTWTAPADNGSAITDYIVQYRQV
jgi:hypothetical protein